MRGQTLYLLAAAALFNAFTTSIVREPGTVYEARLAGVAADGRTDDSAAMERAITYAISAGYGTIQLPCGQIMVSRTIDLTNRSNLTVQGCGSNLDFGGKYSRISTQILCNTGGVCLDTTGSSRITLTNFALRSSNKYNTPSSVAILLGRDNAGGGGSKNLHCFAQFNTLDQLFVYMDTSPRATSRGRVAIYNVGAEHFTIRGGKYIADEGVTFASRNVLGLSSKYQDLQTGCPTSMTVANISEGASFQSWSYFSVEFDDVLDINFSQVHYMCGTPSAKAVKFDAGRNEKISMKGQVENCTHFADATGNLDHDTFEVLVVAPSEPLVSFGPNLRATSCTFKIAQEHGTPQALFSRGQNDSLIGSYIELGGLGSVNSPGIRVQSTFILAPGLHDSEINFASHSQYLLMDDDGASAVGGIRSR